MIKNVEDLKNAIDIVDVISNYIELKKYGANFKANCPFHGEKTPSFVVSSQKQFFKCFGCGVSGDAIKFVQEFKKIEFKEACEEIASSFNFNLSFSGGAKKDYSRVLDAVQEFFVGNLREKDIKYLKNRGLTLSTIIEWGFGFVGQNGSFLQFIKDTGLPIGDLEELGLVRVGDRGIYSHFSNRIMIPIRSSVGKVVGWSGRSVMDAAKAKYINSVDSVVFNKSSILFGWDKAKSAIFDKKFVIIMEGQLDVIASHQVGIKTAVATQGTALTDRHISFIKRANARVILAFDGDNAGRAAAFKGAKALALAGVGGGVVFFKDGEDPAFLVQERREDELKKVLLKRVDFIEFIVKYLANSYNLQDIYEKDKAYKEAEGFLKSLNSVVLYSNYIELLKNLLGINNSREHKKNDKMVKVTHKKVNFEHSDIKKSLLFAMFKNDNTIDGVLNIVDDEAWGNDYVLLRKVLENKATLEDFNAVIEINENDILKYAVLVEKKHLNTTKKKSSIKEIVAINEKLQLLERMAK